MSSNLTGYSSDKWVWNWSLPDGVSVDFDGLSKGSFATETLTTSTFTHKELLNGDGVRSFSVGSSGTMAFLVDQNSGLHVVLNSIYVQDRGNRKMAGTLTGTLVGPFGVAKKYFYRGAYIMTLPAETHADVSNDVTWTLQFTACEKTYPEANAVIAS